MATPLSAASVLSLKSVDKSELRWRGFRRLFWAKACADLGRRAQFCRLVRSGSLRVTGVIGRPIGIAPCDRKTYTADPLLHEV